VQENSDIPDAYKKPTINKNDVNLTTFSLRVPRYVELNWKAKNLNVDSNFNGPPLSSAVSKIITEDSLIASMYMPTIFSSTKSVVDAAAAIKNDRYNNTAPGTSQATIIDNFVTELLGTYAETPEDSKTIEIRKQLKKAISSIETLADNPESNFGYKFYDEAGGKLENTFGFSKTINNDVKIYSQVSTKFAKDIFVSSSFISEAEVSEINANSNNATVNDNLLVEAVKPGTDSTNIFPDADPSKISAVGYIIERYELENGSLKRDKVLFIENPNSTSVIDVNVKYGATYTYSIRAVAKMEIQSFTADNTAKDYMYYFSSRPIITQVTCDEDVSPPPPADLNFVWDYKKSKLSVTWAMPFNFQRDIKQFQIFRRASIYEPFELLQQQYFDYSAVKRTTGEVIDGNKQNMTQEQKGFVATFESPNFSYTDDDFKVDSELLTSPTYIYAIASVDAHGYISNYSTQFQVTFDFYKNQLVKKLISSSGAPRPYPNLLLKSDLFKDVIKTSGMSSKKLKIYFMPEYFKVKYNSGEIQKMVSTQEDNGSYYKVQFINTQNQKSDSLKINVFDPNDLV
jgi:hypothetical protein